MGVVDLDIRLFGEARLAVGGHGLPLRRLEGGTVAILALDPGRVVPVERLIDALWEEPPASARNRVQTMVSRIRRALIGAGAPAQAITTHAAGYRLDCATDQIDLYRLLDAVRRARAAVSVGNLEGAADSYQRALREVAGRPLAGLPGAFFASESARLTELVTIAREELIDVELSRGNGADVVADLTRLVGEFPARERPRAQLMTALHQGGRTAEALNVYREAHAYLAAEFGVSPGVELRERHRLVLSGGKNPEDVPFPARPQQLPPLNKDFTGRGKELAAIVDALAGGGVVAVSGIGGMGKTTLMVAAAHQVARRFPHACLYLNLRGSEATPLTPAAALGMCLRGLGVAPDAIGEDIDSRIGLFRSITAPRRILLLLDNAADEHQVEPLLPIGASAVVITSRRALFALDGAYHLPLRALTPDDGVSLLARMAGCPRMHAEPQAARDVVDLCGGLPLAIRLIGARLALHPQWTLVATAQRLTDERHRLDELEFGERTVRRSLLLSYERLGAEARRLFRLLGFLPTASFADWSAAALLGADAPRTAERPFEELLCVGLVTLDATAPGEPARYQMHDLVAVFARERALAESSAERGSTLGRWLEALMQLTEQARQRLPTGGSPPFPVPATCWRLPDEIAQRAVGRAISWFESERLTVRLAVGLAAELGRADLAWRLAVSMAGFLELRSYLEDWATINGWATAAVRAQPDSADGRLGLAALTLQAADLAGERDKPLEALTLFRSARLSFRRLGREAYAAGAAAGVGKAARVLGRFREATAAFGWALKVSAGSGTYEEGITLLRLGNLLIDRAGPVALDNAVTVLAHARDVFSRIGDQRDEANAHTCLAIAHRRLDLSEDGIVHARRAVDGYRLTCDTLHQAFSEQTLAELYLDVGRLDEAEACVIRSLEVVVDSGSALGEARGQVAWGRLELLRGDAQMACTRLEYALEKYAEAGVASPLTLFLLAKARLRAGDRPRAVGAARQAYALFVERGCATAGVVADWLDQTAPA